MKYLGTPGSCLVEAGMYLAVVLQFLTLRAARVAGSLQKALAARLGGFFIVPAGNAEAYSYRKLLLQYFTKASSCTFCWLQGAEDGPGDERMGPSSLL